MNSVWKNILPQWVIGYDYKTHCCKHKKTTQNVGFKEADKDDAEEQLSCI
jgi:hypothetical protein